ncbi:hypothetical protein K502DRAFT_306314 [Neoconidiobolus thromboides FSU 785]|nr:hypothetical protein K502DRAFT_306314 [Neoconidiobolus thromboides FSU 785]
MSEHSSTLAVLLKRLEQATSRLESLSISKSKKEDSKPSEKSIVSTATLSSSSELPESIKKYDEKLLSAIQEYKSLSSSLDPLISSQSDLIESLYLESKKILPLSLQCKKPSSNEKVSEIWSSSQKILDQILNITDNNRASPFFNHLSAVSSGAPAFSWFLVEPECASSVKDQIESSQFYGFKVIKEYKEKDPKHHEWIKSYFKLLNELYDYVNTYFKTGLTWNPNGIEWNNSLSVSNNTTSPPPKPPKPTSLKSSSNTNLPPPPPPAPLFQDLLKEENDNNNNKGGINSIFSEINQGENVTSGLKKVDKSQKNQPPLNQVVPPARSTARPSPGKVTPASIKEAETKLDGHKWLVQYHQSGMITVEPTEFKQLVYIFNCNNTTIEIRGKCNGVILDSCKKSGVVLDTAIASVDIINSSSCQVQILKSTPMVVIDKTDGLQLYLSKEGLNTEITTAKSSQINVLLPTKTEVGDEEVEDFVERAIPEQFKTTIVDGKLITTPIEHE